MQNPIFVPATPAQLAHVNDGTDPASSTTTSPGVLSSMGSVVGTVGFAFAAAQSYKRNQSLLWALGSGMVWPAYLAYVYVVDKKD